MTLLVLFLYVYYTTPLLFKVVLLLQNFQKLPSEAFLYWLRSELPSYVCCAMVAGALLPLLFYPEPEAFTPSYYDVVLLAGVITGLGMPLLFSIIVCIVA